MGAFFGDAIRSDDLGSGWESPLVGEARHGDDTRPSVPWGRGHPCTSWTWQLYSLLSPLDTRLAPSAG